MGGIARGGLLCLAALGLIETVPAAAAPVSVVSAPTPFVAGCHGPPQSGTAFFNGEIEPYVDVNPRDPDNLVAVYQQDRWSNGGANGNLASVSFDGGQTWTRPPLGDQPRFSRCAGGSEANGGDFERASDPWVTFGPNGDAFQAAVSFNDTNSDQAELVSRSTRTCAAESSHSSSAAPSPARRLLRRTRYPTSPGSRPTNSTAWTRPTECDSSMPSTPQPLASVPTTEYSF
jgi:hypothetical protein